MKRSPKRGWGWALLFALAAGSCGRASDAEQQRCQDAAARLPRGFEALGLKVEDWAAQCREMSARCRRAGLEREAKVLAELTVER